MAEQVRSLLQSLPAIMAMVLVYRLLFNEFLHIVIEPVKMEARVDEEEVVEAVRRYTAEYGGPASWADVMYEIAPEPLKRPLESWWRSEAGQRVGREVRDVLDRLVQQGRLRKVDGGYVV